MDLYIKMYVKIEANKLIIMRGKIMKVIVGGIIEKNGKYLLVQEAKEKCYKKWNFPAGHLDFNESLQQGAIREIKEETGCVVELNGVCYIANRIREDDLFVMIVFDAKLIKENIEYDKKEILDVKWFDYDEIVDKMDDELRGFYVKKAVYNINNNLIAKMYIIEAIKYYWR